MLKRTCCAAAILGLASATLAAAPAPSPSAPVVGRSIHLAFDEPSDVAKVTEFIIEFGEEQTCQFTNGVWYLDDGSAMSNLDAHEDETGFSYGWGGGRSGYVGAMGITTETVSGPPDSGIGGSASYWDGEFSGRHVVTMMLAEPAEAYDPEFVPASMALDITCERPVTLAARASDTLRFWPDRDAPVSATVPFAAEADLFGEWEMTINEPEGHMRAAFWGSEGDQVGEVHLVTPDETVDVALPTVDFLHLAAGPGSYRAEMSHLTTSGFAWVVAYGLAGPLDLTPFLRDEAVIPPFNWEEPS